MAPANSVPLRARETQPLASAAAPCPASFPLLRSWLEEESGGELDLSEPKAGRQFLPTLKLWLLIIASPQAEQSIQSTSSKTWQAAKFLAALIYFHEAVLEDD